MSAATTLSTKVRFLNELPKSVDPSLGGAGPPPDITNKMWDTNNGSRALLEFGFSCMGYEIPAGIGVRMAQPYGEVYVLIGDGAYLMNPTEIVTAVQNGF